MGDFFQCIKNAVENEEFVVGIHALDQLEERRIEEWQVVAGLSQGKLVRERPQAIPNPVVEVEQLLADGTPILAVWSWIGRQGIAKLVTVHFFDR